MKKNYDEVNSKLKKVIIVLAIIMVLECIFFGIKYVKSRNSNTFISALNEIIKVDDKYVGVGISDFKNSKLNEYKAPGYNKPVLWVFDKNHNIVKELNYGKGFNGSFNDIVKVKDGYVVVGEIEPTNNMHKDGLSEGLIVKYDKDFKIVWTKNLQILDNTKLKSVIIDKDENIITVGQSIYANDIIGNHTTGGAILVKYDKDGNKIGVANYGGPKSGCFNDVILVDDGYVTVGITREGTGIIFKYAFNGEELWHNYYGYTDYEGLTSINYLNDQFIVTGSKLEEKGKTDSYKGAIVRFSSKGEKIDDILYEKEDIAKLEKSLVVDDKIIVIGVYGNKKEDILDNQAMILEYDKDLKLVKENTLEGKKIVTFSDIILDGDNYLVAGYTNSKLKGYKFNGYDYYPFIINYDKKLSK